MAKRTPETNRRKLIEEQRKKARAKERQATIVTIAIASLIGLALIGTAVYIAQQDKIDTGPLNAVGVGADLAGCEEAKDVEIPKDAKAEHVQTQVQYASAPPTFGNHNPSPLPLGKKFYSRDDNPPPERAVHNLEHAYVVTWYDSKATDAQIEVLRQAGDAAEGKYLFLPWTRGDFADDKHIVMTAWGAEQRCSDVSGAAIEAFFDKFGGQNGKAPEKNAI